MNKYDVLKNEFGIESFRKGQEVIIDQILEKNNTVGIMPTGAGKSLCYQLPALMFSGVTLVVSPLISLMKDQVNSLTQSGIAAAYLNSSLTYRQYYKALGLAKQGKYKIIYVAPERLLTEEFLELTKQVEISMLTIDEAHCISQWGHDFRPSYMRIPEFLNTFEVKPVVTAFTATATTRVKDDIIERLGLKNPFTLVTGFDRQNLYFGVEKPMNKLLALYQYVQKNKDKIGVVYCSTRKNVELVCDFLNEKGFKATKYHAGLTTKQRKENQDAFIYDECDIVVATNAFGMGIDKSNVSYVIHYNMPKNIESYYQEAGRAGRDGEKAECILYYSGQDVMTNQYLIDITSEDSEVEPRVLNEIKEKERELLKVMTFYCHTNNCLREYILNYFGEKSENYCDNCSSCNQNFVEENVTEDAKKIMSCIHKTGEFYGINMIIDVLKGSKNKKIISNGLTRNPTYSMMSEVSKHKIRDIINYLILNNYVEMTNSQYPTLKLGKRARDILQDELQILMKVQKTYETKSKTTRTKSTLEDVSVDHALFEKLRGLRNEYAKKQRVPAYIIFTDATLKEMCRHLPKDLEQFAHVNGVGRAKLERYGRKFIKVINTHIEES